MDFLATLNRLCTAFDARGLRYALIGGFALAMGGVQRATVNLDLLIAADDLAIMDALLCADGFERKYHGENVSHYRNAEGDRIDLLHAFRVHANAMLNRAQRVAVDDRLTLPVATVEDLIGLKIQAAYNEPRRRLADWQDIRWLIEAAADRNEPPEWERIKDYLAVFGQTDRIKEMKAWYDKTD